MIVNEEHRILLEGFRIKLREAEMIQTRIIGILREANDIAPGEGGGGKQIVDGEIVCPYDCDSCHGEDCPCDRIGCDGDQEGGL